MADALARRMARRAAPHRLAVRRGPPGSGTPLRLARPPGSLALLQVSETACGPARVTGLRAPRPERCPA